jgi:hypothetical protein
MTIVLPLLSREGDELYQSQDCRQIVVATVLSLATIDPVSFRMVLGQMEPEQQMTLELLLRSAIEGRQREQTIEQVKPSISLRLDFASIE